MYRIRLLRNIALALPIIGVVLLLFSTLYTFMIPVREGNGSVTRAILIGTDSILPGTDYALALKDLGLSVTTLRYAPDMADSAIKGALESSPAHSCVLVAFGRAGMPALKAAAESGVAAGLVLISPDLTSADDLSLFGRSEPNCPIILFSDGNDLSRSLYERLSGEDTKLFGGMAGTGLFSPQSYLSPDGSRCLQTWKLPLPSSLSGSLLPLYSGVPQAMRDYLLSTGITGGTSGNIPMQFLTHGVRLLSAVLALAGVFLFYSTVPLSAGRLTGLRQAESSPTLRSPSSKEEIMTPRSYDEKVTRRYLIPIFIAGLAGILIPGTTAFLGLAVPTVTFLSVWPLLYYAAYSPFTLFSRYRGHPPRHLPQKRITISSILAAGFVTVGVLLRLSGELSVGSFFSLASTYMGIGLGVLLFLFLWLYLRIANYPGVLPVDGLYLSRLWFLPAPYVLSLILLLVKGETFYAAQVLALLAILGCLLAFRKLFAVISGTSAIPAAVFAALFTFFAIL